MQAGEPVNEKFKALAVQATEIKQTSDYCSGQSETWSEVNLDAYASLIVRECIAVIEQNCGGQEHASVYALKEALFTHFDTK